MSNASLEPDLVVHVSSKALSAKAVEKRAS
jgi:hypothetical protein